MGVPRNQFLIGDVLDRLRELPDGCVHTCICSPPYWGLRSYLATDDVGKSYEIGLEKTPDEYVARLVEVFREVRRVLRDDGTLWANLGDSHAGVGKSGGGTQGEKWDAHGSRYKGKRGGKWCEPPVGLKPGDLVGIPWRVAFALQADGWLLRSDVIWAKAIEGVEGYSGACMPESVNGWRWTRCRRKVAPAPRQDDVQQPGAPPRTARTNGAGLGGQGYAGAVWEDCPGCLKCEANDGYVLRRGSWRPTRAHEYVFLFAKSSGYYCNAEAAKRPAVGQNHHDLTGGCYGPPGQTEHTGSRAQLVVVPRRNPRDVWVINTEPCTERHYAAYPRALVRPIIQAATAEKVCAQCGASWAPVAARGALNPGYKGSRFDVGKTGERDGGGRTQVGDRCEKLVVGLRPTCSCGVNHARAVVLDPFMGSGVTALVAEELGRDWIGIDLDPRNVGILERRREAVKQARPKRASVRPLPAGHGPDRRRLEALMTAVSLIVRRGGLDL